MKKVWILGLLVSLALTACISVSMETDTPQPPVSFVTSTLPPTKPSIPNPGKATSTPVETAEATITSPPNCTDKTVLLEDVTYPDDTQVEPGESFTKTWRFKNTGTCPWLGYTIVFLTGDGFISPESAPIPETMAGETVDISIDLTAPETSGEATAYFVLKNADGELIPIGTEKSFWVKIIVVEP
jgi:hypothetical protein